MDKLFKITSSIGIYFVLAPNKKWAEEYFFREHPTAEESLLEVKEVKDKRSIGEDDFKE